MIDKLQKADDRRLKALSGMGDRWRAIPKAWRVAVGFAFVVLLFALPRIYIPGVDELIRTTKTDFTTVLFLVAMYVVVAVGLNVVIGLAGLLDLGYIGFFAVGAYTVALFGSPDSPLHGSKLSDFMHTPYGWLLCVPLAVAVTMLSGVLLGWPTLRVRGDYLAIVTLGFGEIVRLVAQNATGLTNGQRGISDIPHPGGAWPDALPGFIDENWVGLPMFGSATSLAWYWLALVCVILCMFASRRLEHSRVGRAWVAIREDEDAAEIMGVQAFKFKLWAFAFGAALGGLAGALYAGKQQFMGSNSFTLLDSILFVAMVVVGGAGNLAGVTLGAILVWYLPERLRGIELFGVQLDTNEYRLLAFGLALIVIMTFRPKGLLPKRYRSSQPPLVAEEASA
ncbi:branched-chain amino acid ABC transporter permease [Longispora sp. K20-0274]|uniref:branched-chain amino acid ABC transporter permease n=1 Tax=Longispora sp. K20-0274 TaxID=3088255 RepID=UPI00399AF490